MSASDPRDLNDQDAIAIIGMAGRFPAAPDLDRFWRNLAAGVEGIEFFDREELIADGLPRELVERPDYVPAKGFLPDVELFDAEFFGLTPREAEVMDPQYRLFLESSWQAFEDAGYDPRRAGDRVGVYGGSSMSTYMLSHLLPNAELVASVGGLQLRITNDRDFLTTWVSYKLDLQGPSLAVQTACSTSLVAVHLGCQGLLDGDCDMALAGGVSISFPLRRGYLYFDGGINAKDGHCRAFDADASGSVEGNGVGVVLMKRLSDALADGDAIHAVIRATAINNDGALKVGYTAPSVESQQQLIAEALDLAGVEPETIGYVEAHGSGTVLGDPIEVEALSSAYRGASRHEVPETGYCALGSVKTSVGHLDAGAGIASLIKTVLALENGLIPPSLNYDRPNPAIDFSRSPFYVNTELRPWPGNTPRRAAVNSLGIGGTNVHAVFEEAPAREASGASRPWQLLTLSARTDDALAARAVDLRTKLAKAGDDAALADAVYTANSGRRGFARRLAVLGRSRDPLVEALDASPRVRHAASVEPSVAFLFPGLGDHHPGMGLELYRSEAVFRQAVDRCAESLEPRLGVDIRTVLYPEGLEPEHAEVAPGRGKSDMRGLLSTSAAPESEAEARLNATRMAHPSTFAVEYALARLLISWGIQPAALIGYSLGEYVAATISGVFTLEQALEIVAERARLIDKIPPGAMLAAPVAWDEIEPLAKELGELSLSASNGRALSVVGGPPEQVDELSRRLAGLGVLCRPLRTTHAFHSAMMEPIRDEYRQFLNRFDLAEPRVPYLSNITGTWITAEQATNPAYWADHLVKPVRFTEGVGRLMQGEAPPILLEVGPGQGLSTLAQQHEERGVEHAVLSTLPDRRQGHSELGHLLQTVGALWTHGKEIDWTSFYAEESRQRVHLPTYPFERRRFFVDAPAAGALASAASPSRPGTSRPGTSASDGMHGKRPDIGDWFYLPSWQRAPAVDRQSLRTEGRFLVFLDDHAADEPGIGERLARIWRSDGFDVVCVESGDGFVADGEGAYRIDFWQRDDYGRLIQDLERQGKRPDRIVHLASLTADAEAPESFDDVMDQEEDALDLGFFSVLALVQALGEQGVDGEIDLTVVTNQVHEIHAGDPLCPPKAALLGILQVIPREHPNLQARSIDVQIDLQSPDSEEEFRLLADEILATTEERILAHRGGHRWRQVFEPLHLGPAPSSPIPPGVHLVTGADQDAGWTMASHLANQENIRLALFVDPTFPLPSEWDSAGEEHQATIERLRGLEKRAKTVVIPVDLGNLDAVGGAVDAVRQRLGDVCGVVHAASAPGAGLMQLKTQEAAAAVFRPKVRGGLTLASALADSSLEYVILFSSTAAVAGHVGQVDVAAANAVLDATAEFWGVRTGADVVSIAWSAFGWEAWEGAGSGGAIDNLAAQLESNLAIIGLEESDVCEIFDRALARPQNRVLISPRDFAEVRNDVAAVTAQSLLSEIERSRPASREHGRPDLDVAYRGPEGDVEAKIVGFWQEVFGIEPIGVDDNFFALSGNSLIAIQLVTRLRNTFDVDLPMSVLFEAPTVAQLAERIVSERGDAEVPEDEMDAILREIEGLSTAEAEARLAEEMGA